MGEVKVQFVAFSSSKSELSETLVFLALVGFFLLLELSVLSSPCIYGSCIYWCSSVLEIIEVD